MASTFGDPGVSEALARILSELNELKLKNAQLEQKVGPFSKWYFTMTIC